METKTTLRPLQNRVLIKRLEAENVSKGGIYIPEGAQEKPQEGLVVAVGKGKIDEQGKLHAPDVKEGDKILFGKYSGSEVHLNGNPFIIMRDEDILGVIE